MQSDVVSPTLDTLSWEEAITLGAHAWESSEQSKWDLGDIGAIVADKWHDNNLKAFANDIGMFDKPKRLYEYVSVAQFWSKDARAQFPKTSWSAFRELSRHKLTPDRALELLTEHHDKPVAEIRRIILGKPSPRPVSVSFPATVTDGMIWPKDALGFLNAIGLPGATITVTVSYTEEATA